MFLWSNNAVLYLNLLFCSCKQKMCKDVIMFLRIKLLIIILILKKHKCDYLITFSDMNNKKWKDIEVSQSLTYHTIWDEGSNSSNALHYSHVKLTSCLITADLLNELRQHGLSCIWKFTVSIYLDAELEAKRLFWADMKSHAAWHFTDITQREGKLAFPQWKANPKWQSG